MKQWVNVDISNDRVLGYQNTGANELPPCPENVRQVELTDEQMSAYHGMAHTARLENRHITEEDGELTLSPDERIYLDIIADKSEVLIKTEEITFTIRKLNPEDDSIDESFNETVKFPFNQRLFRVNFNGGVAQYTMTFEKSRRRIIDSTKNFKIKTPLIIDVVE